MAQQLWVMIAAVVLAVAAMMIFAGAVGDFVERHPTIKVLALSFLILIGVMLVGEGFGQHIRKGYIYFAMAFSLGSSCSTCACAAAGRRSSCADRSCRARTGADEPRDAAGVPAGGGPARGGGSQALIPVSCGAAEGRGRCLPSTSR